MTKKRHAKTGKGIDKMSILLASLLALAALGAVLVLLVLAAPLISAAPLTNVAQAAVPGPAALAVDQNGNVHAWSAQEGAVTIVDFAASWCGPCRESLPRLESFAASHPEVRVLVISVDDAVSGRDALVRDLDLHVPVLWDEDHRAAEHYRPGGMPATFVFDRTGQEILAVVGSKESDWRRVVDAVEGALR